MELLASLVASTTPEFLTGPVLRVLLLGHTVVMAMALPFTVLAVRGYDGAPWGRTLKPLPVVTAALLLSSALTLVFDDTQLAGYVGGLLWGVAGLGIGWSVLQAYVLLTGRREL